MREGREAPGTATGWMALVATRGVVVAVAVDEVSHRLSLPRNALQDFIGRRSARRGSARGIDGDGLWSSGEHRRRLTV